MENKFVKCPEHKKEIVYLCLDSSCENSPNSCFLCIKNKHFECDNDLLIYKQDCSSENFEIKKIENEKKNVYKEKMERVLEKFDYELQNFLSDFKKEKMSMFLSNFEKGINFEEMQNKCNTLKNEFKIEKTASKTIISPKLMKSSIFEKNLENFEKSLQTKKKNFSETLQKIVFNIDNSLCKNSFLYNTAFEINPINPSTTEYSLKTGFGSDYYILASKKSVKNFSLRIKIIKMVSNERFLDIGLIKKKSLNYDTLKINENDVNKFSFCGFKKHKLEGKMEVSSMTDINGFSDGKEYLVTLKNGVFRVKSMSDDFVDVFFNLKDDEEYVFFVTNYYFGVVFEMEHFDEEGEILWIKKMEEIMEEKKVKKLEEEKLEKEKLEKEKLEKEKLEKEKLEKEKLEEGNEEKIEDEKKLENQENNSLKTED